MENFVEMVKGHWANYLVQFPFQWWITKSFKYPVKKEHAKIKLKAWTRKLIKEEKLQIAYFGVINEVNRIHLHLLALGRNRHGKTLLDVPVDKWKKKWKAQSKIQPIYDIVGISHYFERNTILKDDTLSEVILYNLKLLKKVQIERDLIQLDESGRFSFSGNPHVPNLDKKSVQSQMIELIDGIK